MTAKTAKNSGVGFPYDTCKAFAGKCRKSYANQHADVAELVDARDLKSLDGNVVWVRVPPPAPAFARGASEGCRAEAQRAKAGSSRELRLGRPRRKICHMRR